MFVDISGFTKLSEGLARHGKVGGEELAATIGTCFVALLDLAVAYGGRLLKFGGDALLLYFAGDAHEARGCRAAVEMRRALRTVGRLTVLGQKVSLRMSVGVHSGDFHFFLVGRSHRELIVTGPAASTVVTMEGTADAGQIVVSPDTAAALRPGIVGEPKGPGFLLRRAPDVPEDSFIPFEEVDPRADILMGIPVALRDVLQARHQEPEHRRVTVAFIHFDGTDDLVESAGQAEAADQLHELVSTVQGAADRNQVTFLATDVDHDGGKIILTAGAPSTLGDDEHRMLLTLREVMDAGVRLPVRIGVNRGAVFVGEIGPPYRRTFTVMGDAVNLAARLMAKAVPSQLVAAPEVLNRSRTSFATEELEPFMVKGKAKPVRAFLVGEPVGEQDVGPAERVPFVGHDAELAALGRWADEAAAGSGRMVEIVGEPGVGKTRLVEEVRDRLRDRPQLAVSCQVYDVSTPYLVVRRLLRELLGLPARGSDPQLAAQFLDTVAERAPAVLPWAPLVAQAVDLPVPDTDETRELDEEYRRPRLALAVMELLAGVLPPRGLLCIDDAHFMDEASADLMAHLAEAAPGSSWLTVVSRRPGETGFVAPEEFSPRLELGPLSGAEAKSLARVVSSGATLTPRQLDAVVERSGGNPLFLRELVAAARDGGDVDALPDTVDGVVATRIDSLGTDDRFLLRRLAVLGQAFPLDLARDVLEDLPHASDPVWRRLDEFLLRDGSGTVGFRNVLLRDSAYDGLSFKQRRRLHNRAADTIRKGTWDAGDTQPEILSFHYLHGQRWDEAWDYSLMAAERAKAVYANFEAAQFFERALVAGRRTGDRTTDEMTRAYEELADARARTGSYSPAVAAYRSARRLVRGHPVAEARLIMKLARVQGWLDRYATALRWTTKGLHLLDGVEGSDAGAGAGEPPRHVLLVLPGGGPPHPCHRMEYPGRCRGRGGRRAAGAGGGTPGPGLGQDAAGAARRPDRHRTGPRHLPGARGPARAVRRHQPARYVRLLAAATGPRPSTTTSGAWCSPSGRATPSRWPSSCTTSARCTSTRAGSTPPRRCSPTRNASGGPRATDQGWRRPRPCSPGWPPAVGRSTTPAGSSRRPSPDSVPSAAMRRLWRPGPAWPRSSSCPATPTRPWPSPMTPLPRPAPSVASRSSSRSSTGSAARRWPGPATTTVRAPRLTASLEAARLRDAQHDIALTLRAMARFARDRGDADADALEYEADSVLMRLGVEWTLDLFAADGQPVRVAVNSAE